MLDVINRITQAEQDATRIVTESTQRAMAIKADAHKQGKLLVENAKSDALKKAQEIISQARDNASQELEKASQTAVSACGELMHIAQPRMDKAANLIVERIVNTL